MLNMQAISMPVCNWQRSRFERVLFAVALALAGVLIALRIGAIVMAWYLQPPH